MSVHEPSNIIHILIYIYISYLYTVYKGMYYLYICFVMFDLRMFPQFNLVSSNVQLRTKIFPGPLIGKDWKAIV